MVNLLNSNLPYHPLLSHSLPLSPSLLPPTLPSSSLPPSLFASLSSSSYPTTTFFLPPCLLPLLHFLLPPSLPPLPPPSSSPFPTSSSLPTQVEKGEVKFDVCLCTVAMLSKIKHLPKILRARMPSTRRGKHNYVYTLGRSIAVCEPGKLRLHHSRHSTHDINMTYTCTHIHMHIT